MHMESSVRSSALRQGGQVAASGPPPLPSPSEPYPCSSTGSPPERLATATGGESPCTQSPRESHATLFSLGTHKFNSGDFFRGAQTDCWCAVHLFSYTVGTRDVSRWQSKGREHEIF